MSEPLINSSPPSAYSYVRMSTAEQVHGDSLRRQQQLSKDYAAKHGLKLVEGNPLEDIGLSGYTGENVDTGKLGAFLEALKQRRIPKGSFLLMESLDRLTRQYVPKAFSLLMEILDAGVIVVTLIDQQKYEAGKTTDFQLIGSLMLFSRAHEESATKSRRVGEAWANKRIRINEEKLTKKCPAWLTLSEDRTEYVLNANKAEIVKKIFEHADDGLGSLAITRLLNSTNVPTLGTTALWGKSYVEKILTSRAVIGEFQPHTKIDGKRTVEGESQSNYFPTIVEEDLFYRVQTARSRRKINGGERRGVGVPNLFTHVARCYYCKSAMHFIDKGKGPKGGKYLRCSASLRGTDCYAGSWRYSDFEKSFLTFSKEIDLSSISKESMKQREYAGTLDTIATTETKKKSLEAEFERLVSTAAFLQSANAQSNLAKKIDGVQKKIDKENETLVDLNEKLLNSNAHEKISDVEHAELVDLFQSSMQTAGVERRQKLQKKIRAIVESLVLAAEGFQEKKGASVSKSSYIASRKDDALVSGKLLISEMQRIYLGNVQFFDVKFVAGIKRRVGVGHDDPTKLLVTIDDVAASVELHSNIASTTSHERLIVYAEPEELKFPMKIKK